MRHTLVSLTLFLVALPAPAAEKRTKDTPVDRAIDRALEYLAKYQESDGAWLGAGHGKNPAITSLAVMAFLSAGHVPGEGRYGKTVEKGVRWVLKQQGPNGLIATRGGHEMYHHGIATLMLAEVAGMTDTALGKDVRRALEDAVRVILKAQRVRGDERGGWRYLVAHVNGSDVSVTGWQIMALRAAKNLGCDVPAENIDRAVEYIKRCQDSRTGGFCYMPHSRLTIPCTGTSVLALEICGKDRHHSPEAVRGGAFLIRDSSLPRWESANFFYGIYYGAQATFQLGDSYWSKYRPRLHKLLLDHQKPSGFWMAPSDRANGAAYCTAMGVLALTVEYRYLPIYQRGEEPTDRPR